MYNVYFFIPTQMSTNLCTFINTCSRVFNYLLVILFLIFCPFFHWKWHKFLWFKTKLRRIKHFGFVEKKYTLIKSNQNLNNFINLFLFILGWTEPLSLTIVVKCWKSSTLPTLITSCSCYLPVPVDWVSTCRQLILLSSLIQTGIRIRIYRLRTELTGMAFYFRTFICYYYLSYT